MSTVTGADARDLVVSELAVVRADLLGRDAAPERARLDAQRERVPGPGPLDDLESGFGLSAFERRTLLLACGPELVGEVARELVERTGSPHLTFGAALEHLPGAHWDALVPEAPLRRWGLVSLTESSSLLAAPLIPDEQVVHRLAGVEALDEELELRSLPVGGLAPLAPAHRAVVSEVVARWESDGPVVLRGPQPGTTRAVAAAACAVVGLTPRLLGGADLPSGVVDLERLLRRLVRQTVLGRVGWLIDLDAPHVPDALGRALAAGDAPVVLLGASGTQAAVLERLGLPVLEVPRLGAGARRAVLAAALSRAGTAAPDDEVEAAAGAFDLAADDVDDVARDVASGMPLWSACRRRPRADVGSLAQVRVARAGWDRLVLPAAQVAQLRALVATVRHRATVLDDWGFGASSSRGRGTTALFTGDSGTGKTFTAEVLAHDLQLDLVHVDLSQVVDKYVGETEKRLARLFDAAEDGGMVLLFDEADALFGKRSDVKDSHDRYANVEVGYLLQRLEAFTGLAVLTTNARSSLDQAFTRRLSAVVTFPYPDVAARRRMWAQSLPDAVPSRDVDLDRLAQADLSGGGIAAAALVAAFLAADDGRVLTMEHLTQAVRWELGKSGRVSGLRDPR
ncbi:ATP-binding protein [Cellulosimicrobium terreum]|nr:ATP-binding protein [Cellulosimicrobium terreum]